MSRAHTDGGAVGAAASGRGRSTTESVPYLVPGLPEGVVHRPRLLRRLDLGSRGPLTLVTSPAGTGKTVLVASWVRGLRAGRAVWLTLDEDSLAPGQFWAQVVAALGRHGVTVPSAVAPDPDGEDPSFTAAVAAAIRCHHEPVLLVLDCEGALTHDVTIRLESLMRRCGARLRVVLLTREDPQLPLHRYRLAGTITELRMADLAFTAGEARELLLAMGVDLLPAPMDALITRTQGWAAGLRMAAMSLVHRADREAAARAFAGDSGTVAEYLLAEVLDTQPAGVRRLLLDTSVVDVLRPGLASAIAGPQAERALSFLVHGNAFLEELPEPAGSYRYHRLFRELLRAQLAYESPDRAVELHRVAAAWLADHGLVVDAVRHAVVTGDWEAAARYALDDLSIVSIVRPRHEEPLDDALARIPRTADGPAVSIVAAARAVSVGDTRRAVSGIRRARLVLGEPDAEPWPAGELSINVVVLMLARQDRDATRAVEAVEATRRLARLQPAERLAAHPELDALLEASLGAAHVASGDLGAAAAAFEAAASTEHVAGREAPLIEALGQAALLAALRGELRAASDLAARAARVSSSAGLTPVRCPAAAEVALAYVDVETYDVAAAQAHLERGAGCAAARDGGDLTLAVLALTRARVRHAGGDAGAAARILDDARSGGGLPSWLDDRLRDESAAATGVEPGDTGGVTEVGGDPTAPADEVELCLRATVRELHDGDERRAVTSLDQALRLAAPELLRRPFRQAPDSVRQLLGRHPELARRHGWLSRPHTVPAATRVPRPRRPVLDRTQLEEPRILEPLTAKEHEVLGHLSELLTTEEIATEMFISVNTVRTHVRNILRKLAASRRNEAVRRARDLQIIPGSPG